MKTTPFKRCPVCSLIDFEVKYGNVMTNEYEICLNCGVILSKNRSQIDKDHPRIGNLPPMDGPDLPHGDKMDSIDHSQHHKSTNKAFYDWLKENTHLEPSSYESEYMLIAWNGAIEYIKSIWSGYNFKLPSQKDFQIKLKNLGISSGISAHAGVQLHTWLKNNLFSDKQPVVEEPEFSLSKWMDDNNDIYEEFVEWLKASALEIYDINTILNLKNAFYDGMDNSNNNSKKDLDIGEAIDSIRQIITQMDNKVD